ncbi:MAG: metal-dependent hydrolase [Nitrospirae bacterium]|nr:metal-dependent hydrolase [Nitrospirota bacterium]
MSPVTHFLTSWLVANSANMERRDRVLVTAAGVIPDIDGFGLFIDIFSRNNGASFEWYQRFHHVLSHNLLFAFVVTIAAYLLSKKRWVAGLLSFASFHLHLIGDMVGSAGPQGYLWSVAYFWPLSNFELTWQGQWELNSWQNIAITSIAVCIALFISWKHGHSPVEVFSTKADSSFVSALRQRFGYPL